MSTICCVHRVFMSLSDLQAISALDLKEKALTAFSLCWFFTLQHLKAFCCRDNSRTDMALPDTRSSSRGIPSVATRFPLLRSYLCQVLDQVEQAESVSILFWLSASFKWEESAKKNLLLFKSLSSVRDNHFHVPLEFIKRLSVVAQLLLLCFKMWIIKVEVTGWYLSYGVYSAVKNQLL